MADARNAFNFGRDFTKAGSTTAFLDRGAGLPVPYAQHAQLVEEARQAGYQQGLLEGHQQQRNEEAARVTEAMGAIAQSLAHVVDDLRQVDAASRNESLQFAFIFARKLAGKLIDRVPVAPIEATARAILNDLRGAPHVAVRVEPSLVDLVKVRLANLLREHGIDIKLFVFPDPGVARGDCRIEWADGGIVRERQKLEYLLEQSLGMVLAPSGN
ncbi:FliH Flagellar biosynthesis/type III secretory pathway protein [Rhabdaerophilaceae bacterium]